MYCCTLLYVHSSIAIILMEKRQLIALLSLSSWCLVVVVWLFLAVPRVCLRFVISYSLTTFGLGKSLLFSLTTILLRKRELGALRWLCCGCLSSVCLFLMLSCFFLDIGVAPVTQLRTCVIKIVIFMGRHLMW